MLLSALVALLLVTAAGCSSDADEAAPSSSAPASSRTGADSSTTTASSAARSSQGCGRDPDAPRLTSEGAGDAELTFAVDSEGGTTPSRTYRLGVPDAYDPDEPAPLILNLHGSGSDAIQQSIYSDLPRQAGERGFITVTPDAIEGKWQLTPDGADDEFLTALVDDVEGRYCVDLNRVHVAGISLGAWKASLVGCNHPDRYASMALVAEEVHPPNCPPMPVIAFHGTADRTVPYGDGADEGVQVTGSNADLPGARKNVADWAEAGGCAKEPDITDLGDDVVKWNYPECDEGVSVQLYTVKGGGHTWPGSKIEIGPTTQTIDATQLILDFFEGHPARTDN